MLLYENCGNTNQQGAIGESIAEVYFRLKGFEVARLGSNAPYDLMISNSEGNYRVQVKTSRNAKGKKGTYTAILRTNYGHGDRSKYKTIDPTQVNLVFIVTNEGDCYLLPAVVVEGKSAITLNDSYSAYKVCTMGFFNI